MHLCLCNLCIGRSDLAVDGELNYNLICKNNSSRRSLRNSLWKLALWTIVFASVEIER